MRNGDRLRLVLSSRGVDGHNLITIGHTRAREDGSQRIRLDGGGLVGPVDQVGRGRVAPRHVLPLRAIGVPLVVQVPNAVLVEHAVRIIHPSIGRGVVIGGAESLAVGCVKRVAHPHLAPAGEILDSTRGAAVTMEGDVNQHLLVAEALDIQRHIVVHLVHRKPHVEIMHLLVVHDDAQMGVLFFLLHGQQQVLARSVNPQHSVVFAQHLGGQCRGREGHEHCRQNS